LITGSIGERRLDAILPLDFCKIEAPLHNDDTYLSDGLVAFGAFVEPPPRCDGKRFIVRADEKLTAFLELQAAIHGRFEAQLESHA
jgi:hypothetical protein